MASCISCAARLGIVYLVILNLATLLLGVGLIVACIYLRYQLKEETEILDFLDQIDLGSFTFKDLVMIVFVAVIVIGVFAMLTSLCGGCGALCKVRCLLITYIVILVLCILVELTILGFWVYLLNTVNEFLLDKLNVLMKEYSGTLVKDVISLGWNVIFIVFTCCGVKPVTSSYNDFSALPTEWWSSERRNNDVIPVSCCENVTIKTYIMKNSTMCTEQMVDYHTAGCYDIFDDIFTKLSTAAISVIAIIVICEALAIFFSCLITCFVKEERSKVV